MAPSKQVKAKNGKHNGKPKTRDSKPKIKPPKPTIEQLSDQQQQNLLLAHRRKLKPLLEAEKQAKAAVTKAYELAKKEGVPKYELKLAIFYDTPEGEEKQKRQIDSDVKVARWLGLSLGSQLDMFGTDKRKPAEKYYEDGRIAALDDQPRKPPSHIAQTMTVHWFEGYDVGRKAMNTERAAGFRPIGDVVDSLVENAAPPPPTAAPTEAAGPVH